MTGSGVEVLDIRMNRKPLAGIPWLAGLFLVLLAPPARAAGPVAWTARLESADVRAGEHTAVVVTGTVEAPWHVYSTTQKTGPKATSLELLPGSKLKVTGPVIQPPPKREFDEGFKTEVELYEGKVDFRLPVQLAPGAAGAQAVTVKVTYMACKEGLCTPVKRSELPVTFKVQAGAARPERSKPPQAPAAGTTDPGQGSAPGGGPAAGGGIAGDIAAAQKRGLLAFLLLAFSMGFVALLTPCVFPMIPVTVSFFSKQQGAGRASLGGPLAYCLGIIGTFTGLGLLVTALFGAGGINRLSTNPIVNIGLAILFVVLALNLFGVFEIMVPASLIDRAQSGSRSGGLIGPMLMGLTFTLTSFTCTVPFVGTLLASTTQGSYFWPVVGMLAFSTAFALPFFLLALFPQWLASVPKAGSWLVTVKAFMGFVELAAALKFLSNVDLAFRWGFLTRPAFLAVWFAIAAVAALYMLGWLRLPHGATGVQIGPMRRLLGLGTAAGAVYCLTAISGSASLGWFSGLLPPSTYPGKERVASRVKWLDSYEEAVVAAREQGKPLFLNFTGIYCTNCRTMEDAVFERPEVAREFEKFVPVELYTDRGDPQSERYRSLQIKEYGQDSLPLYVVTTPDGKKLGEYYFNPNPQAFIAFLEQSRSRAPQVATRNP